MRRSFECQYPASDDIIALWIKPCISIERIQKTANTVMQRTGCLALREKYLADCHRGKTCSAW